VVSVCLGRDGSHRDFDKWPVLYSSPRLGTIDHPARGAPHPVERARDLIVPVTAQTGGAILVEAAPSFLGLGPGYAFSTM
jgi:hypothetical protein